jgi:hypothetical protein
MTKAKIPKEALRFFREAGAEGGKKSSGNMTPEERRKRAKKAVSARERKRKIVED